MADQVGAQVFLHIGTRKSGTSYLQWALRNSVPALRDQGVDLTFTRRKRHVARQLEPLRRYAATGDATAARENMEWMVERFRSMPEARHLITLEDLAELPPSATELMLGALGEFDLHVVITARHWGLTIPSEWQQCVKERYTGTYPEFLAAVRDRSGAEAELFLARQDLPAIIDRWGANLDPAKVHVIAVPPFPGEGESLESLFCALVGIDPATLRFPNFPINQSLSLGQAELLRRVNAELGDRLPFHGDGGYQVGIRDMLVRGTLMKTWRRPIRMPDEFAAWCGEQIQRQYEGVVARGVDLIGEKEHLLPTESLPTGSAEVAADDVLQVAVAALADLGELQWQQYQELDSLRAQAATPAARPPLRRLAAWVRARLPRR